MKYLHFQARSIYGRDLNKLCLTLGLGLAFISYCTTATAQVPQTDLPRASYTFGKHQLEAQIANTPSQQEKGLMFRQDMPENEGMLFDFGHSDKRCFWMQNTPQALTAAFLDETGKIINLADMQALSERSHCSSKPARYVLEMRQGWFKKRAIKPGAVLKTLK